MVLSSAKYVLPQKRQIKNQMKQIITENIWQSREREALKPNPISISTIEAYSVPRKRNDEFLFRSNIFIKL